MICIKTLFLTLIAAACALLGYSRARESAKGRQTLEELITSLCTLEREISYGAPVLAQALSRCATGKTRDFFSRCAKAVQSGKSAGEAWRENDAALCLAERPARLLRAFADSLGKSGVASQRALILQTVEALKPELADAAQKSARLSRLYVWLGVSGGAAVVILLI